MVLSVLYMLSFHLSLKRKPQRGHCFRRTTFFSPQIKKSPALHQRKLNWIFLPNFSRRNIFLHFKTIIIFLISYFSLSVILLNGTLYLFSKLLSASNQQLFCATESDIRQGPSNHTSLLYELLVSVL